MTPMRTASSFGQSHSISHFVSGVAALLFALQVTAGTGVSSAVRPTPSAQATPSVKPTQPAQPDLGAPAIAGQAIDEATGLPSYLVQLRARARNTTPAAAAELIDRVLADTIGAARARFRYEHAVIGFAASMNPADAAAVRAHPLVARVEPDMMGAVVSMPEGAPADPNTPNPWGLRRISQANGLAPAFTPCGADGTGVTMVIIDSGINPDHTEFAGRVQQVKNFYPGAGSNGGRDIRGHGTHVAGCAAGTTTGPAPGAGIISLAVTDANGRFQFSTAVAALNWVVIPGNVQLPAVVNMSLSGEHRGAAAAVFEEAISSVMLQGIPVVVAAGNESWPASWMYPAASAFALTVGAADADDHPAVFSNYGPDVSIWAPGTGILAADWMRPTSGLKLDRGTSMASPMVAGVAALYLQRHPPTTEERSAPLTIASRTYLALMSAAARGKLTDLTDPARVAPGGNATLAGSANRLLQACDRVAPIACADDEQWIGESKSIILGDGITPIDASFQCIRNVRHPSGPVSITVNAASIGIAFQNGSPVGAKARLGIIDAATGAVLWNSDVVLMQDAIDVMAARTVRSSSVAGVYVAWQPVATSGTVGFGYAMTATVGGGGSCIGDLDGNGSVDGADLAKLLVGWGACPTAPPACIADLNGDASVDGHDMGMLLAQWGSCVASSAPGYVADCNGNPVLRSYYGDLFRDGPGTNVRPMRPDPINSPYLVYPVTLDCAALGWDSDAGNQNVVSFDDPRAGAGTLSSGQCGQATYAQCYEAGAFFWGRGLNCQDVPGLASLATLAGCGEGDVTCGLPIGSDQPSAADPTVSVVRQTLPVGINSISSIRFIGSPGNIAGSSSVKVTGYQLVPSIRRYMPTTDFAVRVTVRFRDGGAPLVVDRPAIMQPYGPAGEQVGVPSATRLITVNGILPPSGREVLSVSVQAMPEGIDSLSSIRAMTWAGRPMAADEPGAGAEYSPDASATWLPLLTPEGVRFQAAMCVVR